MSYLHSKRCIHRDLAARNVLIDKNLVAKIADFGLARSVNANDYYRKSGDGCLPVRWMSPESIFQRTYTTKSDVWSFGVLLWEILTYGGEPYAAIPIESLLKLLKVGYRLERPLTSSEQMYGVMLDCWNEDPSMRPSFEVLKIRPELNPGSVPNFNRDDYVIMERRFRRLSSVLEDEEDLDDEMSKMSGCPDSNPGPEYLGAPELQTNMSYINGFRFSANLEVENVPTPTRRIQAPTHAYVNQDKAAENMDLTGLPGFDGLNGFGGTESFYSTTEADKRLSKCSQVTEL